MSQGTGGYGPPGNYGYGPPQGTYGAPPGAPPGPPYQPPMNGSWSASDAVGFGFQAIKNDYVGVAVPVIVYTVVLVVAGGIISFLVGLLRGVLVTVLTGMGVEGILLAGLSHSTNLLSQGLTMVLQAFLMGGLMNFVLQVVRGGRPPLDSVFTGTQYFLPMLVGQIIMTILVGVGMLLLIVPGIILALGLMFWSYLVVDKNLGPIEALQQSWALTSGHKMNLFVFGLLGFVVALGGMLACCIGVLFGSIPILAIATAYVYLRMSGETPRLAST